MSRLTPIALLATGFFLLSCGGERPPTDGADAESPGEPVVASVDTATDSIPVGESVQTEDGARLFYEIVGSGPQWVLVPHHLFLRDAFAARPELLEGRTVVFYDLRNRGRSQRLDDLSGLSIYREIADLESVRRHVGAERVSLIGFSYLGKMVAMYALEHPDRVERIVQLAPTARDPDKVYPPHLSATDRLESMGAESVAELQRLMTDGTNQSDPQAFCRREWEVTRRALVADPSRAAQIADPCAHELEWPVNLSRHYGSLAVANQQTRPTVERLATITAPVLTIHGTRDRHAPYGSGREWAYDLPAARLLTVEGAAHALWIDAPEIVFAAMASFLDGEWPPGVEEVERADPRVGPGDET